MRRNTLRDINIPALISGGFCVRIARFVVSVGNLFRLSPALSPCVQRTVRGESAYALISSITSPKKS